MAAPSSITVIGGGISGLSAALHLSRRFPVHTGTPITLVEGSSRLGGWVQSERVRVRDANGHQAEVLLESGPRTLRPNSKAILELIHTLGLKNSVLTVSRQAPAARNRFLHVSGREGLVTIPGSIPALLRSPLARVLVPAVLRDALSVNGKVLSLSASNDESVETFLSRHFGPVFAQTFGSALIHGIYATDARLLSVRAAFPVLCRLEESGNGSLVRGVFKDMLTSFRSRPQVNEIQPYDLGDTVQLMKGVSVYSFQNGMQTLTDAMARQLQDHTNVDIVKGDNVVMLRKSASEFELTTQSGKRVTSSHLVSAVSLPRLHRILADSSMSDTLPSLPHLLANPTSTVTVVNLVFPPSATPIHPDGFGYLIPRPTADYPASTLGMLGTVFDSCALPGQDHYLSQNGFTAPGRDGRFTKVTVMLEGPYGTPSPSPSSSDFLPALLEALRTHLGHKSPLPEPSFVRVREQKDCIPTPTVGHAARMAELAAAVRERWGPNAAVIGAAVGGVSVGDCIEAGRRTALEM